MANLRSPQAAETLAGQLTDPSDAVRLQACEAWVHGGAEIGGRSAGRVARGKACQVPRNFDANVGFVGCRPVDIINESCVDESLVLDFFHLGIVVKLYIDES